MSKDIKDTSSENKKVQSSKKSSYSKKKKSKKIITSGIAYVQSNFNNTTFLFHQIDPINIIDMKLNIIIIVISILILIIYLQKGNNETFNVDYNWQQP